MFKLFFQISVVPNGVDGLQLTELNLNQNQISSLSSSLAECPRLKTLRLEENCLALDALPNDLLTKSTVSTLCLAGNMFSEKQLSDLEGYPIYLTRYTAVRRKLDWAIKLVLNITCKNKWRLWIRIVIFDLKLKGITALVLLLKEEKLQKFYLKNSFKSVKQLTCFSWVFSEQSYCKTSFL